ncbi:hypothetical protein BSPWISOXPB_4321 [uncultured Gammaproteobacteria bacterium]|nr:hypothetical protein BSPWISOXPB_4321 [uncultured Gammaproteobacteria bacterium]
MSNTGLVVKTYSICQDHQRRRNEEGIATVHSAGKSWAHALTEKEKAIAFMKDWVTFANGKMEVYQRNVVTGKVRLLTTTKDGVWVTIDVEMKEN